MDCPLQRRVLCELDPTASATGLRLSEDQFRIEADNAARSRSTSAGIQRAGSLSPALAFFQPAATREACRISASDPSPRQNSRRREMAVKPGCDVGEFSRLMERTCTAYVLATAGFGRGSESERFMKDWESVSRNDRKTSTENPIRNANASGGIEADCPSVKLLKRPTTPPAIAATTKCAEFASD